MQTELVSSANRITKSQNAQQGARPNGRLTPEAMFNVPAAAEPVTITADITPEIASMLLEMRPPHQRHVRPFKVQEFVRLIEAGQFQLTHQGIAFDADGHLIDGQHRMLAIVKCATTVKMMVTLGLDRRAFSAMDRGATRSVADDLITDGFFASQKEASTFNAAAKYIAMIDRGIRIISSKSLMGWTMANAMSVYDRHPALKEAATLSQLLPRGISRATFAALWTLFFEKSESMADTFAEKLIGGEGLMRGDPVYVLREWCLNTKGNGNERRKADEFVFRSINAWNAMRQGRDLRILRGAHGESPTYPKII